jgi:hypothetical protein
MLQRTSIQAGVVSAVFLLHNIVWYCEPNTLDTIENDSEVRLALEEIHTFEWVLANSKS